MLLKLWQSGSLALLAAVLLQCGGRSAIPGATGEEPKVPCTQDGDCIDQNRCVYRACVEHFCAVVDEKDCNDGEFCTADSCDEASGACVHQWRTSDNDQDGAYAALPGTLPGTPNSCGDDCNDAIASVHPGASEQCDGFDNNCDGRVDEGTYEYIPGLSGVTRVTDDSFTSGGPTGLAYNGTYFGLAFTGSTNASTYQGFFSGFDSRASRMVPIINTTQTSKDGFAGPLVWTGSVFGTAWEVRGDRGYDIHFNELDSRGQKMGPDVRISNSSGFSIQPTILWNGAEYWIAWSDDEGGDLFQILGRRVSGNRDLTSDVQQLTALSSDARTPTLLKGPNSTLLLYLSAENQQIRGRILDGKMSPVGNEFRVSGVGASNYSADWVQDRFVIVWSLETEQPGNAIWATSIDTNGTLLQNYMPITTGSNFARTPNLLSLGDRFALAWADDRVTYAHYGIRMSTYGTDLLPLSGVQTVAETSYDCIDPTLAAGGFGLALVYRERTYGQTGFPYFAALTCSYAMP